ncbi:MAG: JAB domain-containing protein, partial [Novosphingobium sp.]
LSAGDRQLIECLDDHRQIGERIIAARSLVQASFREEISRSPVDPGCSKLRQYLVASLRGRPYEELLAIFTDEECGFLSEEIVATGGSSCVTVHNRPLLHRALELGAHGILLVHNHPSRKPRPSPQDIESTRRIALLVRAVDIHLIDHLIVAGRKICSMREMELL